MSLITCKNPDDVASRASAEFTRIARESISERGAFAVALSGGSTPILLYKHLLDTSLDWDKVYFFFSDERNVPPSEDASNFRSANKELFRPLRIREDRIFRWRTELGDPEAVADDYFLQLVKGFEGIGQTIDAAPMKAVGVINPSFDLVLLGMGSDGHTASLFPDTDALEETEKFAIPNWVPQLGAWRFTLSLPVINRARNVNFLVTGSDKADTLLAVFAGEVENDLPAKRVHPAKGKLIWFADQAAASKLPETAV